MLLGMSLLVKKARLHSRFCRCSWSLQQERVDPYSLGLRLSIDIAEKYNRNGRVKGNLQFLVLSSFHKFIGPDTTA